MKRNYGIDAARIVAMLMVIMWHIVVFGGIVPQYHWDLHPRGLLLLDALSVGCVDLFGLISGYAGFRGKHRLSSLSLLWLQVFTINAVIITVEMCCGNSPCIDIRDVLAPVVRGSYWYFTAYVPLYFLMPMIDGGIEKLTKRYCVLLILFMLALFTMPKLVHEDPFKVTGGYSFAWLMVLYIIGACLRRIDIKPSSGMCFAIFLGCSGLLYAIMSNIALLRNWKLSLFSNLYGNISLVVVMGAIFLLLGVVQCSKFFERYKRFVVFFSTSSFGVYLIHDNPIVRTKILRGHLSYIGNFGGVCYAQL